MKLSRQTHSHSSGRRTRRKVTITFIAAACLGFESISICAAPQKPKPATDEQITHAVDHRLLTDAALLQSQVTAKTSQGIVTLSGTVEHLVVIERAVKLAQTMRGVRGVVNTIKLDSASVPDAELQKNVLSALHYDAATGSYKIQPTAKDGVVTLSGTVSYYSELQLAEFVVKGVKGVREVQDNITVQIQNDRPDAEILAAVKRLIGNDVGLNPHFFTVTVKDGTVTLTGAVGSPAQRERVSLLVLTAGVKFVNAVELQIEPWAKSDGQRSETEPHRDDEQIQQAVKDSLASDPRAHAFNLNVIVIDAVVTLTGMVDNLKALRDAGQDAMNTTGVWRVMNLLKVRPDDPVADAVVSQNVGSALRLNPVVDTYEIVADVKRGVVTLTGTVNTFFEKAEAEDIASRAKSVVDVKNLLLVSNPLAVHYDVGDSPNSGHQPFYLNRAPTGFKLPYLGDREVKYDIEDAYYWSPWVKRGDITVKVVNGMVTLTGEADSWIAYHKATEIAYQNGAIEVFNNITVR